MINTEPSSEGIGLVRRLFSERLERNAKRSLRIKMNKGIGSTKTAYSMNYCDFLTQYVTNISGVYRSGDRSSSTRVLTNSALTTQTSFRLPAIEAPSMEKPKAIEGFPLFRSVKQMPLHANESIESTLGERTTDRAEKGAKHLRQPRDSLYETSAEDPATTMKNSMPGEGTTVN